MKEFVSLLAVAAASLLLAIPASAAVLGVYEHAYGSAPGRINPPGNDTLGTNFVRIRENRGSGNQFRDSIDFSDLAGATIDSLTLTLTYDQAGPSLFPQSEYWVVDIHGSNPSSFSDDFSRLLEDAASPFAMTISALTDTGTVNAFATALSNLALSFSFDELLGVGSRDNFRLFSAALTVNGTAATSVVPLPAPGLLLLGALGGLGLMRRRRGSGAATT